MIYILSVPAFNNFFRAYCKKNIYITSKSTKVIVTIFDVKHAVMSESRCVQIFTAKEEVGFLPGTRQTVPRTEKIYRQNYRLIVTPRKFDVL